jgi:hypothetical protein
VEDPIALKAGEQVLWEGQPDPRAHFARWDWFLIPFSIVWAGFTIFWLINAVKTNAPIFAIAIGSTMALFGLYLCIGRFVVKARTKRLTRYWITSSRAVIRRGTREDSIALNPDAIRMLRSPWSDRVDVHFGRSYGPWAGLGFSRVLGPYANTGLDFFLSFSGAPFAFYDINDGVALREALSAAGISLPDRGSAAP